MGIETSPRYQPSFIDHKSSAWEPRPILELTNPDRGYATCVGYAPSQRRRCRNPISAVNQAYVSRLLNTLGNTSPESKSIKSQLEEIATLSLCLRDHQSQVDSVVDRWLSRISLMQHAPGPGSSLYHEGFAINQARPEATRSHYSRSGPSASQTSEKTSKPSSSKYRTQEQEQDTAEFHRIEERRRREKKQREAEQIEREQEEREREERQREQRRREERERIARAERVLQEEKIRQQAAQRKREEQQKQAQAKAAQERKAWDEIWETYVKTWAVFKESKDKNTPDSIAWPVKSGRRADVTEANVKAFFRNAPPNASDPTALFKTMSSENIKWHPDKIMPVLGKDLSDDVAMIGRIVIELRATAQRGRNR